MTYVGGEGGRKEDDAWGRVRQGGKKERYERRKIAERRIDRERIEM